LTKPLIVAYRPDHYAPNVGRTYVVLGAPRGGTSLLAGALHVLGIPMGSVNYQHEDPIFHDENNIERMIQTIAIRNRSKKHWGWKLPNTIYYYDRLAQYLRNPVFMVIYRNPFEIFMSASSKGGDGLNDPHFNAPVYHYARMHKLIHDHGNVPTFVMSYEAVCKAPARFVDEFCAALPIRPSKGAIEQCRAFIDEGRGYTDIPPRGPLAKLGALLTT
jgi:hypothetical protein